MSDTIINVENLTKRYILSHNQQGQGSYKSFRDAITDSAKSLIKTIQNPKSHIQDRKEEFLALNNISFEIKRGDRVGIIGRNGAGKSTLLKVLSRIVEPTQGRISIKGRVASLLEVGTGFHPELSGRENIFLNGAILGMSKAEIKSKFDEIVAFAEVEKFLDTPVKRYSSGMYVRLAFAVAAHLEPEILIVDEVLAVGDVEFQKKCLGKMQDISTGEGRTILFVSHQMEAIQRLCSRCLMLERGQLTAEGDIGSVLAKYLSSNTYQALPNQWIDVSNLSRKGTGEARFVGLQYSSLNEAISFQPYSYGQLEFVLGIESESSQLVKSLAITLYEKAGAKLVNADIMTIGESINLKPGFNSIRLRIDKLYLNPGIYTLGLWLDKTGLSSGTNSLDYIEDVCQIEVVNLVFGEFGVIEPSPVICDFKLLDVSSTRSLAEVI